MSSGIWHRGQKGSPIFFQANKVMQTPQFSDAFLVHHRRWDNPSCSMFASQAFQSMEAMASGRYRWGGVGVAFCPEGMGSSVGDDRVEVLLGGADNLVVLMPDGTAFIRKGQRLGRHGVIGFQEVVPVGFGGVVHFHIEFFQSSERSILVICVAFHQFGIPDIGDCLMAFHRQQTMSKLSCWGFGMKSSWKIRRVARLSQAIWMEPRLIPCS